MKVGDKLVPKKKYCRVSNSSIAIRTGKEYIITKVVNAKFENTPRHAWSHPTYRQETIVYVKIADYSSAGKPYEKKFTLSRPRRFYPCLYTYFYEPNELRKKKLLKLNDSIDQT